MPETALVDNTRQGPLSLVRFMPAILVLLNEEKESTPVSPEITCLLLQGYPNMAFKMTEGMVYRNLEENFQEE